MVLQDEREGGGDAVSVSTAGVLRRRRPQQFEQQHGQNVQDYHPPNPPVWETAASGSATRATHPPSPPPASASTSSQPLSSGSLNQEQQQQQQGYKLARLYCLFSLWLALVAILSPPISWDDDNKRNLSANVVAATTTGVSSAGVAVADPVVSTHAAGSSSTCTPSHELVQFGLGWWPFAKKEERLQQHKQLEQQKNENIWDHIFFFWKHRAEEEKEKQSSFSSSFSFFSYLSMLYSWLLCRWIDPILWQRPLSPSTLTDLLDKILTSTPRLLALANLLLSWTYLLHAAVADWFLNSPTNSNNNNNNNSNHNPPTSTATFPPFGGRSNVLPNNNYPHAMNMNTDHLPREQHLNHPTNHHLNQAQYHHQQQQQQHRLLGGFLVFKMLLVSAIVAPDTLDWMILLTWYTLLSFLRSLSQTCAQITTHTAVISGMAPQAGVVQLLLVVLVCDILAAACCVALFHGAGWGMVFLLTCDCALLGVEVIGHLLEYTVQFLETQHAERLHRFEQEEQNHSSQGLVFQHHQQLRQQEQLPMAAEAMETSFSSTTPTPLPSPPSSPISINRQNNDNNNHYQIHHRRLEILEQQHARRLTVLEAAIFALQLVAHLLTCAHFMHIWSLHGVQFTLIDGVLALHLHSAVTAFTKKIADRRHLSRIARDLDALFANATELELRKAAAAGDVCCICLCSMSVNVKKVACGHLYHTVCLREVVERARSMEAVRCPLCRSSVVTHNSLQHPSPDHDHHQHINNGSVRRHHESLSQQQQQQQQNHPGFASAVSTNETANSNNVRNGDLHHAPGYHSAPTLSGIAQPSDATPAHAHLPPIIQRTGDHHHAAGRPLFRFSTDQVFPDWLPLPAVAFEVVRRPSATVQQQQVVAPPAAVAPPVQPPAAQQTQNRGAEERGEDRQSFLRRLLILIGIPAASTIILTPEQEAAALEHLVDMFPQYDRRDLLRELRRWGSAEIVAESILAGSALIVRAGGGVHRG